MLKVSTVTPWSTSVNHCLLIWELGTDQKLSTNISSYAHALTSASKSPPVLEE